MMCSRLVGDEMFKVYLLIVLSIFARKISADSNYLYDNNNTSGSLARSSRSTFLPAESSAAIPTLIEGLLARCIDVLNVGVANSALFGNKRVAFYGCILLYGCKKVVYPSYIHAFGDWLE